jgi:hypothetical protein
MGVFLLFLLIICSSLTGVLSPSLMLLDELCKRLKSLEQLQRKSKLLIEQAQIKEKENYAR